MAIKHESYGDVFQCDGCGRIADPAMPGLVIREYVEDDANVGSGVTVHYCGACAQRRNLDL